MTLANRVAIVTAMNMETQPFLEQMRIDATGKSGFTTLYEGVIGGKAVVVARCGIGKIAAAMAAQLLCDRYRPSALIVAGASGGIDDTVSLGDVVIANPVVSRDVGTFTRAGFVPGGLLVYDAEGTSYSIRGVTPDGGLLRAAREAAKGFEGRVVEGVIASGDSFIMSSRERQRLRQDYRALAVEMEGAAAALVALANRVPFIMIRGTSDLADDDVDFDPTAVILHDDQEALFKEELIEGGVNQDFTEGVGLELQSPGGELQGSFAIAGRQAADLVLRMLPLLD